MNWLKKIFFHSPGHYIAALVLAIAVGAFRFSTLPDDVGTRFAWYEILSVSGFMTFLIGALLMVSYYGAFDLVSYALSPGRIGGHGKYKNYADYSHQKLEKRSRGSYYFVPYYVVGIAVVLISCLFS